MCVVPGTFLVAAFCALARARSFASSMVGTPSSAEMLARAITVGCLRRYFGSFWSFRLMLRSSCGSKEQSVRSCGTGTCAGKAAFSGCIRCAGSVLWTAPTVFLRPFRVSISAASRTQLVGSALQFGARVSRQRKCKARCSRIPSRGTS